MKHLSSHELYAMKTDLQYISRVFKTYVRSNNKFTPEYLAFNVNCIEYDNHYKFIYQNNGIYMKYCKQYITSLDKYNMYEHHIVIWHNGILIYQNSF